MKEPIRVLHVLGNTQLGGAESRIMDLYRHLDRDRVQFDFLVHTRQKGHFDEEIEKLGGRIFRVPRFRIYNIFAYKKALREFFREHHEFAAVQGHITSTAAIYLPIAREAGIPVTIAHARSAGVDKGIKGTATRLMRRKLSERTDYMFTCSRLAGISVFGEKAASEGRTVFIPNAIDCPAFGFDPEKREEMRRELGLSDKYVIGHVGRFHYAKNHEYLLRVFAKLCEREGNGREYALILLGEGAGMESARSLAGELGISGRVHFLGNHGDIYNYYQAMDYFVYPSRFEGLPGTIVEAQASGLRCVMSDAICEEVSVTPLVHSMSIGAEPEKWADYIISTQDYERTSHVEQMQEAGFDVSAQAERMTEFYETRKRKLMLISPMLHQGGFERVCITTAKLLQPYFDITIVIFDSANIAYDVTGLKIIDIHMGVRKGKLGKLLNVARRSRRVREIKRRMGTEIAYSFGPTANIVNSLSKTGREKVWLGLRNYTDVEERMKLKLFVRRADLIICCSREIEKELRSQFDFRRTAVLYNLYDVEAIRREAAIQEKSVQLPWGKYDGSGRRIRTLVSMGRDDDMKGFWHLLKVFYLVHEQIPEVRLILMGAGSFELYKKLAADLGISDFVFFAGLQREPYKYLKKGQVYLLTSSNEGFPNALVEGMALKLAPVSTDCMTGPAEILLENGNTEFTEKQFEACRRKGRKPVIFGEYGILVPVMEKERDLDPGHITEKERNMAAVVADLVRDEKRLAFYREAAGVRAHIFTYENYIRKFLELAGQLVITGDL